MGSSTRAQLEAANADLRRRLDAALDELMDGPSGELLALACWVYEHGERRGKDMVIPGERWRDHLTVLVDLLKKDGIEVPTLLSRWLNEPPARNVSQYGKRADEPEGGPREDVERQTAQVHEGWVMGDRRRFTAFAELIAQEHPSRGVRVADVAGGKGYLQMALRGLGYTDIVTFDKRRKMANPIRQRMYRYEWFSFNRHREEFGLVVAMHPDEGTDHSILYAVNNRVPFLVCPCCIRPSAAPFWKRSDFPAWVEHLEGLAAGTHEVRRESLRITGRNLVLVGVPRKAVG